MILWPLFMVSGALNQQFLLKSPEPMVTESSRNIKQCLIMSLCYAIVMLVLIAQAVDYPNNLTMFNVQSENFSSIRYLNSNARILFSLSLGKKTSMYGMSVCSCLASKILQVCGMVTISIFFSFQPRDNQVMNTFLAVHSKVDMILVLASSLMLLGT